MNANLLNLTGHELIDQSTGDVSPPENPANFGPEDYLEINGGDSIAATMDHQAAIRSYLAYLNEHPETRARS